MFGLRPMRRISTDLRTFRPQELANFLESFTQLNIKDNQVCDTFAREMQFRDLKQFPFQSLASVTKSFALLGHRNDKVNAQIAVEVISRFSNVPPAAQPLIDMMWAFACMDVLKLPAVYSFFHLKYPAQQFPPSNAAACAQQLFETQLAWNQTMVNSPTKPHLLESLTLPANWVDSQLVDIHSKRKISPTCELAHDLLAEHFPEVETGSVVLGGLPVDLLIKPKRTIVEVFHPEDFFRDGVTLTGRVLFRQRMLLRANFRMYRLSDKEFAHMTRNAQKLQIQHLVKMIKDETPRNV